MVQAKKKFKSNFFELDLLKIKDTEEEKIYSILTESVEKYDEYDDEAKEFLLEIIKGAIMIFRRDCNPLDSMLMLESHFETSAKAKILYNIPDRLSEFLEKLLTYTEMIDEEYPRIYDHIICSCEGDFCIIKEYLRKEAKEYEKLEVTQIITEYADSKELLEAKKRASQFIESMDSGDWIEVKSCGPKILDEKKGKYARWLEENSPLTLVEHLNKYIIGQEDAKETAAMALYFHILFLENPQMKLKKGNYLFFGPSGSGKTEIWRRLKEVSPIDILFVDASRITAPGYQGAEMDEIFSRLAGETQNIEESIILFDEFDKLCRVSVTSQGNMYNEECQGAFLTLIEGGSIKGRGGRRINTQKIMFIFAGAFIGLDDSTETAKCGFVMTDDTGRGKQKPLEERLIRYGIIPEIMGRITGFSRLHKLTRNDYVAICTKVNDNALVDIQKKYEKVGIHVSVSEDAIEAIADKAAETELGAREIFRIFNDVSSKLVFCAMREAQKEVEITAESIEEHENMQKEM